MNIEEITPELREFIRERFGIPENDPDFNDNIDLFNYGYIDSLGAAELTSFVERRFGIKFSDSDWVTFPLGTIQDISKFVAKRSIGEI